MVMCRKEGFEVGLAKLRELGTDHYRFQCGYSNVGTCTVIIVRLPRTKGD